MRISVWKIAALILALAAGLPLAARSQPKAAPPLKSVPIPAGTAAVLPRTAALPAASVAKTSGSPVAPPTGQPAASASSADGASTPAPSVFGRGLAVNRIVGLIGKAAAGHRKVEPMLTKLEQGDAPAASEIEAIRAILERAGRDLRLAFNLGSAQNWNVALQGWYNATRKTQEVLVRRLAAVKRKQKTRP